MYLQMGSVQETNGYKQLTLTTLQWNLKLCSCPLPGWQTLADLWAPSC